MIQEQAAAAVIIALIFEKNKSRKKRQKTRVCVKPWLKKRKSLEFYETLLVELRLKDEYDYNILLRMTIENFEEIFQLIRDDITKENTKLRELISPRIQLAATIGFLSTGELYKSYVYENYSSYSTMLFNIYFFFALSSSPFFLLYHLCDFSTKISYKKQITWFKLHSFN